MISRLLNLFHSHRAVIIELELERAKFFSTQREIDQLRADIKVERDQSRDLLMRVIDFAALTGWNVSMFGIVDKPKPRQEPVEEPSPRKRFAGDVAAEMDTQFDAEYSEMVRKRGAR